MLLLSVLLVVTGCSAGTRNNNAGNENQTSANEVDVTPMSYNSEAVEPIVKTDQVYTTARKLALTFSGLPERDKLEEVLQLLDHYNIIATFFVPGHVAAVEPELLQMIVEHGHEVENNTLSKVNMDTYTYNEIVDEVAFGRQTIEEATGQTIKYVRSETASFDEAILKAAAQSRHDRYIGYSLFLTDEYLTNKFTKYQDLRNYIKRGAIVAIDLERNEQIEQMLELLVPAVDEVHYHFVRVDELMSEELTKLPYSEIAGYDLATLNKVSSSQKYNVFDHIDTVKKQIAITLDDWGTDYSITNLLDILAEKNVKATFFVRADGAERNPSLARAILEEGHEVSNHSYSHPIITQISSEQLQEEIVHAHQILTEALQQAPTMYFRPPNGETNDKTAQIVAATGYTTIPLFNIDPNDWNKNSSAVDIVNTITTEASNGGIILLHMLDNTNTLEALPVAIDKLRAAGYEFVTIAELMQS